MSITITKAKAELRQAWRTWPLPDWSALLEQFLTLPQVEQAGVFMLFYGMEREPDTVPVIETLLRRGKRVTLPRCLPGRQMEAREIKPGLAGLVRGAHGIPEPDETCPVVDREKIDLVLVPNLCCDWQRYRLGHGGGYYDRWLEAYRGVSVALCPSAWMQKSLSRERFDHPVDVVITG